MDRTLTVLGWIAVFLILFDIYLELRHGSECTISQTVFRLFQKYPIIAVAIGVVIGHIAWPMHFKK